MATKIKNLKLSDNVYLANDISDIIESAVVLNDRVNNGNIQLSGNIMLGEGKTTFTSADYMELSDHLGETGTNVDKIFNAISATRLSAVIAGGETQVLSAVNSIAGGKGIAVGNNSIAIGFCKRDEGKYDDRPFAIGDSSFALGNLAKAVGDYSVSLGSSAASGKYSVAVIGTASGRQSFSAGAGGEAAGQYSAVFNSNCTAKGTGSTANGNYTTALGDYSHAEGNMTTTKGSQSFARGSTCLATAANTGRSCGIAEGFAAVCTLSTELDIKKSSVNGTGTPEIGQYIHWNAELSDWEAVTSLPEGVTAIPAAYGDINNYSNNEFRIANGNQMPSNYFRITNPTGKLYIMQAKSQVSATENSYVWNGDSKTYLMCNYETGGKVYHSHGNGTFNINPEHGLSGFYIGEKSLADIIDEKVTEKVTNILNKYKFGSSSELQEVLSAVVENLGGEFNADKQTDKTDV